MRKDTQGQEIRKLRLDAHITLDELSSRIGVDFSYLSRMELGQRPMPLEIYFELRCKLKAIAAKRLKAVSGG